MSINQDASAEASDPANAANNKLGLNAKDDFPWPEQPLPTFFDQLPAHNQELLRRARAGERESKPSIWDRKAHEWVRYDEARKRGITGESGMRKSRYLMNVSNEDGEEHGADNDDDASDDGSDDDDNDDAAAANGDATTGPAGPAAPKSKKRKQPSSQLLQDRTFDVKKWTQIPFDKADKMPEPKYLADRRPGMANYYNASAQGAWAHAQGYGIVVGGEGGAAGGPAYDLGDGAGLGNAMGGQQQPGNETPVRKNMPPRPRKKKGGPGRKKKEVVEAERRAAEEAKRKAEAAERGEILPEGMAGDGEGKEGVSGTTMDGEAGGETPLSKKDGGDGSGDDSEGDGSEEGEVNESGSVTPSASGTAAAGTSSVIGLGLNAPAIPSSLSQVALAGTETEQSATTTTTEDALPPQLDAQMSDAPPVIEAAIPPPAAEPTVPETLVTAIASAAPAANPSPVLASSPITPTTETIPADATSAAPATTEPEISVPFAPAAAAEEAPLLQGVEVPTAEQLAAPPQQLASAADADVGAAERGAGDDTRAVREEQAVREAAVQGEAEAFRNAEAVVAAEDGEGMAGKGNPEDGVQEVAQEKEAESVVPGKEEEEKKEQGGDALDLLGGLEREVEEQQGRKG